MTPKKYKFECFFCFHEILNGKFRLVKFRNMFKKVCYNCSPSTHKACKIKYKDCYTDCSVCNYPTKYNNCLKCDYCNHMVHARCNNLSNKDVLLMESLNNYMCQHCHEETFPFHNHSITISTKKVFKQNQASLKQCFLCPNIVLPRRKYTNKAIIYNTNQVELCHSCSIKCPDLPVKEKNNLEFINCPICDNIVKYHGILCSLCQCWVHPNCNGIDNEKNLKQIGDQVSDWICHKCTLDIFPNYIVDEQYQRHQLQHNKSNAFETYGSCSECNKKVKTNRSICCTLCKHWVHGKCIDYFSTSTQSFSAFLKYYEHNDWFCPSCLSDTLPFIDLNNKDFFIYCLEEMKQATLKTDEMQSICNELSQTNMFDKIKHSVKTSEESHNNRDDLDPDMHFENHDNCKYIFNLKDINQGGSTFTIMNYNICRIRNKLDSLIAILSNTKRQIDIIAITETWLQESDNIEDYKIDGYHLPIYDDRKGKSGGGVLTYIHDSITTFRYNKALSFSDSFNHCLAIDFTKNNKKHTHLNCYRSPSDCNNTFTEQLDVTLTKLGNKNCIISGDFNYNLFNISTHRPTQEYYNILTEHSFRPLITKPTRITGHSQTLIDHIWTNNITENTKSKSYILITDLSDHLPCVTIFESSDFNKVGYKYINYRKFTDSTRENFRQRICDGKDVLHFLSNNPHTDTQQKYKDVFDYITKWYDDSFPLKTKKIHTKTLSKPWITPIIQDMMDKRNRLFAKKNQSSQAKTKFKKLKSEVEEKLAQSRKDYYTNKLNKNGQTLKDKWDTIREIINRKKNKINDPPVKYEALGKHYSTLAENLANKIPKLTEEDIPKCSSSPTSSNNSINSPDLFFEFREITENEVYECLLKLDINKGAGVDNLDTKSIKYIADIISPCLKTLFNLSIKHSVYPSTFKIAKCVPIYKGNDLDPLLPVNYRPIAILNSTNKVFERLLHDQIYSYLETNKLLPYFQYGYRKKHSTSHAILDYINTLKSNLKQKLTTIAVFMDLSKAFDTVDKDILANKLHKLGFSKSSRQLVYNYMTDRSFCFKNNLDEQYTLQYGVPQGSILGPLLFITYTYDMKYICPNDKTIVYADDTTVLISGRTITEAMQKCNGILNRFVDYFNINKLSVNPTKTKYMIYKPKHTKAYLKHNDIIKMDNKTLEKVQSIKFLGLIINNNLTWEEHKQYLHRKVSKTTGIINNCRKIMTNDQLIKMYKTFIQSNFLYGIEIWGHTVVSDTDILVKLQNKVLRILFKCKRTDDAWRHSHKQIQTIPELYTQVITRTCFKHFYGQLPEYFSSNIMPTRNVHTQEDTIYNLRSKEYKPYNYQVELTSSTAFHNNCISIWNKIPVSNKLRIKN